MSANISVLSACGRCHITKAGLPRLRPVRRPFSGAKVEGRVERGALPERCRRESAPQPLGPNLRLQGSALVESSGRKRKLEIGKGNLPWVESHPLRLSLSQSCAETLKSGAIGL